MGAGGVLVPPRTYFDKIQPVLKKHDVLLIADEVICGFGRLGTMFGLEHFEHKAGHRLNGQAIDIGLPADVGNSDLGRDL